LAAATILELHSSGLRFVAQNDNLFLAGPTSGGPSTPTFRGIAVSDIANSLITYAKIQDVSAASRLLGRGSASGSGVAQEITLGANLSMSGTTLNATATTTGGGGGGLDPNSSIYPPFTVGANDDEFSDGSFTGWTAVNSGSNVPNVVETNHVASFLLPGGHANAELAAYMKAVTPAANDFIEIALHGAGVSQNFNIAGLLFADGTTFGAGTQIGWTIDATENLYFAPRLTGYNTQTSQTNYVIEAAAKASDTFLRFKYEGSNHWRGYVSPDGVQWVDITGQLTFSLTPTAMGFFVSTYGGANPFCWALRYFKHAS
ncbi:MAG TPA: hypothetical protein VM597_31655, partial [Gemmataceae bacterium]|nr:hypothetical protein [Gemmataceae bacterium]